MRRVPLSAGPRVPPAAPGAVLLCLREALHGAARKAEGERWLLAEDPLGPRRMAPEIGIRGTPAPLPLFYRSSSTPFPSPPLSSGGQKSSSGARVCACARVGRLERGGTEEL